MGFYMSVDAAQQPRQQQCECSGTSLHRQPAARPSQSDGVLLLICLSSGTSMEGVDILDSVLLKILMETTG